MSYARRTVAGGDAFGGLDVRRRGCVVVHGARTVRRSGRGRHHGIGVAGFIACTCIAHTGPHT